MHDSPVRGDPEGFADPLCRPRFRTLETLDITFPSLIGFEGCDVMPLIEYA